MYFIKNCFRYFKKEFGVSVLKTCKAKQYINDTFKVQYKKKDIQLSL